MIGLLVAVIVCALVGAVVDQRVFGAPAAGPWERVGRALLLGLGTMGALSMATDALGLGVSRLWILIALGVLVAGLCWRGVALPESPQIKVTPAWGWARPVVWGLGLLTVVSLVLIVQAGWSWHTFQFDALTRWMFKAKVLALDETLRGPISQDPTFAFTHQRYPPLVSHVANLPQLVTGRFDDRIASGMFPWYAVALVGVVYGAVARRAGRLMGAVGAAWVATLPLLAFIPGPPPGAGAFSAMADVPLAAFVTGAGLALADALDGRRPRAFLEAGLFLGFAALTKNEGLPLMLGATLAVLVCASGSRVRAVGLVLLPALAIYAGLWGWLAATFPALDENYLARLNPDAVSEGLGRVPVVLGALLGQLVSFREWNITWIAALVLLVVGASSLRRDRGLRAILILVVVQVAAYVGAFVVTSWSSPAAVAATNGGDPVTYLMDVTLGRLLLHVAPLVIACALMAAPPADEAYRESVAASASSRARKSAVTEG